MAKVGDTPLFFIDGTDKATGQKVWLNLRIDQIVDVIKLGELAKSIIKLEQDNEPQINFSEIYEKHIWQIDPGCKDLIITQALGWIRASESFYNSIKNMKDGDRKNAGI